MNPLPKDIEEEFDERFAWLYDAEVRDKDVAHDFDYEDLKSFLAEKLSAEYQRGRNDAVEYLLAHFNYSMSPSALTAVFEAARTTEGREEV